MKKTVISVAMLILLAASAFAFKSSNDSAVCGDCSTCATTQCCVK